MDFAKSNGWKFVLKAPASSHTVEPGTYSYADNFLPKKVRDFNIIYLFCVVVSILMLCCGLF